MSSIERGRQAYTAWFTAYPSTHERAGQTVEVVTRDVYEALARHHAGAVEALRALVEASEEFFAPNSLGAPVWPRTVDARKLLDSIAGQ